MSLILNGSNTPTAGGIGYGDGSNLVFNSVGTSGQVLTSAGSGAPTWTTPSAGAMTLISTQTASNSASLSWTGLTIPSSGVGNFIIDLSCLVLSASGAHLYLQVGTGLTPTWKTSGYDCNGQVIAGSSQSFYSTTSGAGINLDLNTGNIFSYGNFSGTISMNVNNIGVVSVTSQCADYQPTAYSIFGYVGGVTSFTSIRLIPSSGTISSGIASLYALSS